jgi:hypothetical protein
MRSARDGSGGSSGSSYRRTGEATLFAPALVAALVRWSLENAPVRYNPHKVAPGAFHPPRAGGYCTLTSDDESAMNRPEYATLTTLAGGGDSGR